MPGLLLCPVPKTLLQFPARLEKEPTTYLVVVLDWCPTMRQSAYVKIKAFPSNLRDTVE